MREATIKAKLMVLMVEYQELLPTVDECNEPKELISVFQEAIKILKKIDKLMEKLDDRTKEV